MAGWLCGWLVRVWLCGWFGVVVWLVVCSLMSWAPAAELILLLISPLVTTLEPHTDFSPAHSRLPSLSTSLPDPPRHSNLPVMLILQLVLLS